MSVSTSKNDPKKILLLRFSSLGDIVMTTAMIRCVRKRFPDAQIDMVVREDFADLIRSNPHLNGKIYLARNDGFGGLKRLAHELSGKYDLVYDAHRSLRTRFLMPKLKSTTKAYFNKHYFKRSLALTFKLPLLDNKRFLEKFIEPLEVYGVVYDGQGPEVFVPAEVEREVGERFHLKSQTRFIGLVPSAQWPGKRWPIERFKAAAEALVSQTDHKLLIFGGKEDHFCDDIVSALPKDRFINLQGKVSILEAAALLKKCKVVIANDTGLLHVADAVGVACVAILGPTSGELGCLPFQPKTIVVEEKLWCRPCSKNGEAPCIRGRRVCLENISVERVTGAALQIVRGAKK